MAPLICLHLRSCIPWLTSLLGPGASSCSCCFTDNYFLAIHQSFWRRGEDIFVKQGVKIPDSLSSELDDNSETLQLVVIDLPGGSEEVFGIDVPKLLVTPIYETFWDILRTEDRRWQPLLHSSRFSHPCHATIVTGQPGIGQCAIAYIFYNSDLLDLIPQENQPFLYMYFFVDW